jgi:hypothetical protein
MLEIVILDDYSLYIACSFLGKATRCIAGIVKQEYWYVEGVLLTCWLVYLFEIKGDMLAERARSSH